MLSFFRNLRKPKVDLAKLLSEGALVIDVRTNSEFSEGHFEGSKNIPLNILSNEMPRLKKIDMPIITVCRSGSRSRLAKSTLITAGIEAYNGGSWMSLQSKKIN